MSVASPACLRHLGRKSLKDAFRGRREACEKRVDVPVFERFLRFCRELDGRVKVAILGAGVQNWSQGFSSQYNQLYARGLGAQYVEIGSLNSISGAVTSIAAVPLGWIAESYGVKKVLLLGFLCSILSAIVFGLAGDWWILIPAFVLGDLALRIIYPLTDVIFINCTKPGQSGTVMGLSRVVWGSLNIFAPMAAAVMVASFGGINVEGIRPLYFVQLFLAVLVFIFMALKLEALPAGIDRGEGGLGSRVSRFVQDFRELFEGERWLKRWMVVRTLQQFAMRMAFPFIPLWMVTVKGADPYILGVVGAASAAISSLLQVPAGRLSDRVGRKKAYYLLRPLSYLGTLLLILAPRPEYLILVGLLGTVGTGGALGGGAGGVSFTPLITMHWEMVPGEKRGRWYSVEGLISISAVPAAILGGLLWQYGLMIWVLLIPILLEVLVAIPIMITVPDTLNRDDR